MIDPLWFYNSFKNDIGLITGVPDSLLSNFCNIIPNENHIVAANEGNAIALGAGSFLASKKIPLIYMQNSGLGNAINPLTSLVDESVYSIPMIIMIGWRGSPNSQDEPQHIKQGGCTTKFLKLLNIEYLILNDNTDMKSVIEKSKKMSKPIAILVKPNTFFCTQKNSKEIGGIDIAYSMKELIKIFSKDSIFVSTTGYTSRILNLMDISYKNKFLVIGSMGHCSQVAFGISKELKDKLVLCLDGDGSISMHMGGLATIGKNSKNKFVHVLFNNRSQVSVQCDTIANDSIDYNQLSKSLGYKSYILVETIDDFKNINTNNLQYPCFFEIKTSNNVSLKLPRPNTTCIERKNKFL